MATSVSAGAATAGVRGGIGLCSSATSVITLVTIAAAKSESWNTYMVNDHRPAFLKPLTAFWTDAAFLYATLRISATCYIVTGLPTCSLIHNLSSTSSTHHFQTVRKRSRPKSGIGESCVAEVRPYDHSSFPSHISCNQILCVGHVAIEYDHNSWFNKIDEMSKLSNKPPIGHPAFAGAPTFVNSIFILFRLYMTIGTKFM